MKNDTIAFMMSLLGSFLTNPDDEECMTEIVTKSMVVIYSDNVRDIFDLIDDNISKTIMDTVGDIDKKTVQNFLDGYKIAVDKYGLHEGTIKIKEKLIEAIVNNSPYTRDKLIRQAKITSLSAKLMVDGIHVDTTTGGDEYEK